MIVVVTVMPGTCLNIPDCAIMCPGLLRSIWFSALGSHPGQSFEGLSFNSCEQADVLASALSKNGDFVHVRLTDFRIVKPLL